MGWKNRLRRPQYTQKARQISTKHDVKPLCKPVSPATFAAQLYPMATLLTFPFSESTFLMKKILFSTLVFCLFAHLAHTQTNGKTYEYRNGQWYSGVEFVSGTWYVVNGLLTQKAPAKVDSVIDLTGNWVVPPMGDAASSSLFSGKSAPSMIKQYMDEGVFYIQVLNNTQESRKDIQPAFNHSNTPDAIFTNGAITCSYGEPFLEFEGPAQDVPNPADWAKSYDAIKKGRKLNENAYWFVDNKNALNANWPKIEAQKPDMIVIYLLDAAVNGGKESKGLSEDVAKAVVKKAHKSNLRVWARIETADDVRIGLKIGVDGFLNLPGHNWDGTGNAARFEISNDDLKKLVKKRTPIATLLSHAQSTVSRPAVKEFQSKMLSRLLESGANLVIASDDPQRTIRGEINYLNSLAKQNGAYLIRALCENTPAAIFPGRKIGKIKEGYEASFLVLNDDPFANVLKIRASAFKVKNGVVLNK